LPDYEWLNKKMMLGTVNMNEAHGMARFHMDHLPQVIDVALEGCRNIYTILDKVTRENVERQASTDKTSNGTKRRKTKCRKTRHRNTKR